MSKQQLTIPKKSPLEGDTYTREDGVVFTWGGQQWQR